MPRSAPAAGLAIAVFTSYIMDQELAETILKTLELILFVAIWNSWVLKDYLVKPLLRLLLWFSARLRRTRAEGVFGVRAHLYALTFILLWGLTVCVLSLWWVSGRSWSELGLGTGTPLRCGIGFTIAALYIAWWWSLHRRALLEQPPWVEQLRQRLATDERVPRTPGERRWMMLVVPTTGFCEEILFRGYVMWYLTIWTGPVAAVALSSILFGFGHLEDGVLGSVRATIFGVVFALIVLIAGSLWPAIVMHTATDLISLEFAYRLRTVAKAETPDMELPA
jgi:membrane protease YdiL (CAAX protease family)